MEPPMTKDQHPVRNINRIPLSLTRINSENRIMQITGNGELKKRLLEMGFVENTIIKTVKFAPLSDPIEFALKGYHISLRHAEAYHVLVEPHQQ